MDPNTFPTKGNLILAKNSLKLSRQGYELMDKKRNILIREMMDLIDQAKDIQTQIDVTFRAAYAALQKANMEIGIAFVQQIACTVPIENSIRIKTRSVMGTEIPLVEYDKTSNTPTYAYYSTKMSLDASSTNLHQCQTKQKTNDFTAIGYMHLKNLFRFIIPDSADLLSYTLKVFSAVPDSEEDLNPHPAKEYLPQSHWQLSEYLHPDKYPPV